MARFHEKFNKKFGHAFEEETPTEPNENDEKTTEITDEPESGDAELIKTVLRGVKGFVRATAAVTFLIGALLAFYFT